MLKSCDDNWYDDGMVQMWHDKWYDKWHGKMFQNILITALNTVHGYDMHGAQCYGVFPNARGNPQQQVHSFPVSRTFNNV